MENGGSKYRKIGSFFVVLLPCDSKNMHFKWRTQREWGKNSLNRRNPNATLPAPEKRREILTADLHLSPSAVSIIQIR